MLALPVGEDPEKDRLKAAARLVDNNKAVVKFAARGCGKVRSTSPLPCLCPNLDQQPLLPSKCPDWLLAPSSPLLGAGDSSSSYAILLEDTVSKRNSFTGALSMTRSRRC